MDRDPLIKKRAGHGGDIYSDESRDWLDLSANINPGAFPPRLYEALPGILEQARAYPDIEYRRLRKDLAAYAGAFGQISIDPDWILPGNGAVEILDRAIASAGRVLLVAPCFSEYELSCLRHSIPYETFIRTLSTEVVLGAELFAALQEKLREGCLQQAPFDLIVLCNPNNPDGKRYDVVAFASFLAAQKGTGVRVMVDETFGEYLEDEEMLLPFVRDYEGFMVVKALTKFFGLPGVRLGYGITRSEAWRRAITDRLTTWNVGSFAQGIAGILIKEAGFIAASRRDNRETRRYLYEALRDSGCFDLVYPSAASFIMVYRNDMELLIHGLKHRGILIRDLSNMAGLGPGYARIAVKDRAHAEALVNALAYDQQLKRGSISALTGDEASGGPMR